MGEAFDRVCQAFEQNGLTVVQRGSGRASAQAPGHSPADRSVSLMSTEGAVLMYCHAGESNEDVLAEVGLTLRDLFDNSRDVRHEYPDTRAVWRSYTASGKKAFTQRGNTKGTALYGADRVGDATTVYVGEGEKDCDAIAAVGGVAVCNAQGAGKAPLFDWSPLHGKNVVIIADKDEPGRRHAQDVAKILADKATIRIVEAAVGKDAADHLAAGKSLDELVEVATMGPPRRARITWATEIEPEPVVWAWEDGGEGRIPAGSLSVAGGREGTGKSSFGIWMSAHASRGTLPGSFSGTPRKVFYVALEDSWKYTLVPRLIAAGADLNMIGRFEVVSLDDDELTLSLPHDNAILESEINQHNVALVVIDPLMSVIGERIDTHREREVRSALDPLAKIADRTGAVILGIAHFSKGGGTDAASLITGSGAFKNVPRSVFGFARDDADENQGRVMTQVKNSLGRDDLPSLGYVIESADVETKKGTATTGKFVFTGESDRSVADILRDSRTGPEEHEERKEATAWLVGYLIDNGGEMPAKDVFKAGQAEGYTRDVLKRAKGKRVRSVKVGDSWAWQLAVEVDDQQGSSKGAREQEVEPCSLAPLPAPLPPEPDPQPPLDLAADVPPGGLKPTSPGQTTRVQQILDKSRNRHPRCLVCGDPVVGGQGETHFSCTEGERSA